METRIAVYYFISFVVWLAQPKPDLEKSGMLKSSTGLTGT